MTYFDHSATTPVDKDILKTMLPYFSGNFGNASSIHQYGQKAMEGVEYGRQIAAKYFNCQPDEIVFTGGATEANNLAIRGLIAAIKRSSQHITPHVITSVIEHDSVLEPFAQLEREGTAVTHIPVDSKGVIIFEKLEAAIKDNTVLISIMYVNSEVGSIQPIRQIGKLVRKINEQRQKKWEQTIPADRTAKPYRLYFHTDATQAINFLPSDVKEFNLDMLSMSAHKIYGPKGVGLLVIKQGTPLTALQLGGHHENNRRSGTLNVPGIVGLGKALENLTNENIAKQNKKIAVLRNRLVKGVKKLVPNVTLNTDIKNATPGHAHFSFHGIEGESILISLDLAGVAVSTGSACASNSLKASHVLIAMGIPVEIAHSSIRFTLGKHNKKSDVDHLLTVLPDIISRLRNMAPKLD
ncbi:MAG: cysteine desulfurase family protein [Candidatus Falkowbacteria bacterium]